MELCINLQSRVFKLEKTKTFQGNEIASLKRRIKKLEKRNKSRTHKLKRLYKVGLTARVQSSDEESLSEDASKQERRIDDIDQDDDTTLVSVHDDADVEMFNADKDLGGEEVFVEQEVVADKEEIDELSGPTKSVADEAVYKELDDRLVRATTNASRLKVEQDS
nr:hypothetical protein [Tanacetum cinerariifolium]